MGRKTKTWEQITNGTSAPTTRTLLSQTDYNEIGQPTIKHLHSTDSVNFYQSISYTYNERGWLLSSSAPLFAMQLNYNVNLLAGSSAQYNGNIANQLWGIPGSLSGSYNYRYDKINRLTSGKSGDNNYIERSITYDLNGNIQTLGRVYGGTLIDSLAYGYGSNTTNQLLNITDATTNDAGLKHGSWTYTYNGNGHLSADPSKGINLTYNILNLPQAITGTKTITYTYDATGQKLRRVSPVTGNTDYISGIQYDAGTLSFIQTEEGKAVVNGTGYDYQYYLGDNLGNTRVTFSTKTSSAVAIQKDDYLPFGMEINSLLPSPKNEYLYNGKELQEETVQYDYGARFYDPIIARWNVVDPMAEVSRRWSVYNYVENNPIRLTDPDGMTAASDSAANETFQAQDRATKQGLSHSGAPGSHNQDNVDDFLNAGNTVANSTNGEDEPQVESDGGPPKKKTANQGGNDGGRAIGSRDTPGITVYLVNTGGGITIPGVGIFIDKNMSQRQITGYIQHEYGHYLQYLKRGRDPVGYILGIGIPSFINATYSTGFEHDRSDIELDATTLAHDFYGKFSILNNIEFPTFYTNPQQTTNDKENEVTRGFNSWSSWGH